MSNEIVPVLEGSETRDVPSFDLFIPRNTGIKVDLIGGNHQMRHFVDPEKGHKHVTQLNPTPASVKPLLEKIKEPSVLWLRGCESLLRSDFPFLKFKTLISLEISGCTHLTTLPEKEISEMSQLQNLNLSHLGITKLPHDFFSNLANLRSLVLRGCSNLHSLPDSHALCALECLDLSGMLIQALPDGFFSSSLKLRWIILRGCSRIRSLPSTERLRKLEVLDLSHCTTLQEMEYNKIDHFNLEMLDLSYTALRRIPQIESVKLTHIFLRGAKVNVFQPAHNLFDLKVLDLSGAQNLNSIGETLRSSFSLVILDLSRTAIEFRPIKKGPIIEFIDPPLSSLCGLVKLILRECLGLVKLPAMKNLINLEVLDISGCEILDELPEDLNSLGNLKELHLSGCSCLRELREGLFDEMSNLEILDLSKTNVNHLPSFAGLTNLQTLNLSQTSIHKVPDLSNLLNLKDFVPPESDGIDFIRVHSCGMGNHQENPVSNSDEFHLVSTFISDSGFDRFKYEFKKLDDLMSNIEKNMSAKRSFRSTHADLKYIFDKIDILESSRNCSSSEELLLELMNVASNLSADDFPLYSTNTSALIRTVAKLKLLIPPPNKKVDAHEKEKKKKKKPLFKLINDEEDVNSKWYMIPLEVQNTHRALMHHSYESLTDIQRNCLLYFALFPYSTDKSLDIKERIIIQLWYGEGFIDPVSNQFSQQGSTSKGIEYKNTIKEIGQQILEVLEEKKFISDLDDGIWHMDENVHKFVKERAKEVHFFNFDDNNGKLTPHFAGSQRACLLKSQDHCPSSCNLWQNYMNSAEKLERFQKIQTLLYVNEPIVDIKREWFSNMKNLYVLHLCSLHWENEKQVDIVDLQFLEELINMKQLGLLSLEGFAALKKLPDSVSNLTNLKLLNLRYCSNLEELPDGIGSLGNLTHLDLTQCHLLSELPKGVRLLSKLEVLKGFVITYLAGGRQHRKACTLKDLLNLENLRKLSLVVNKDTFPESKDLQVLREMENLYNLKITWQKNSYMDKEPKNATRKQSLRHSRWQQLKCWEQHRYQSDMEEEPLRSRNFDNLTKLVLCCFPLETAPNWLHQGQFQMLQKLYIVGGNLKTLPGDTNQSAWNIETLHLKYLPNLEVDEEGLKHLFSNVSEDLVHKCPLVGNYESESE